MQQMTEDDLLMSSGGGSSANLDEKERTATFDGPPIRQARPEFSFFMNEELK